MSNLSNLYCPLPSSEQRFLSRQCTQRAQQHSSATSRVCAALLFQAVGKSIMVQEASATGTEAPYLVYSPIGQGPSPQWSCSQRGVAVYCVHFLGAGSFLLVCGCFHQLKSTRNEYLPTYLACACFLERLLNIFDTPLYSAPSSTSLTIKGHMEGPVTRWILKMNSHSRSHNF